MIFTSHRSPIGDVVIGVEKGAIAWLRFEDAHAHAHDHDHDHGHDHDARIAREAARALDAYFDGDLLALDSLELAPRGTNFQKRVWEELRKIPAGTTTTYGHIARAIGSPHAARAVGAANGANPIAIVVPCHRVVGADGTLTGYAFGIDKKRWLLEHEQRNKTGRRLSA
jgi:methylated-DNA-[protein]-cysteine S-methyltransferase